MRIVGLGIADLPGSFVTRSVETVELTFEGIAGDHHSGPTAKATVRQKYVPKGTLLRNSRQLSIVSVEELELTARNLKLTKEPDWRSYGANVCVDGAPTLTQLAPGTRLIFESGAVVVIDGENEPCIKVARLLSAQLQCDLSASFVKAARHLRGLVGWVERPGAIRIGDEPRTFAR